MMMENHKIVPLDKSAEKLDVSQGSRDNNNSKGGPIDRSSGKNIGESESSKNRGKRPIKVDVEFNLYRELQYFYNNCTYANLKLVTVWFLDTANIKFSISFDDLMMLMTFYVLFIGDITIMAVNKHDDSAIEVMTTICLFCFIFELLAASWSKTTVTNWFPLKFEGYCFSFFFWLDLIAILSMLPDIDWIARGLGIGNLSNDVGGTNSSFSQAARVVRTVRLVRLVRVYKITAERRRIKKINDELMLLLEEGAISYEDMLKHQSSNRENKQSKVGAELSDTTTRRVILIVLAMLCLVPVLSYNEPDNTQYVSTRILHDFNVKATSDSARQLQLDDFLDSYRRYYNDWYLLRLEMSPYTSGNIIYESDLIGELRSSSVTKFHFYTEGTQNFKTVAWFNNYATQYNTSVGGILLIIFVTCVMLIATVVFTSDAQHLVLDPIERMMAMVEEVAKDPLRPLVFDHQEGSGEFETRLLESTIEKITGLLRIGFGEAGAMIISENLSIENNSSVINPLIPGVRVYAIFGFCDIHHFETVNEKLGKEIMTFVNTVAAIVHSKVHSWAGQCNKNLGNAFLIVWRIGDAKSLQELLEQNGVNDKNGGNASPSKKVLRGRAQKAKEIDLTRVAGVDVLADRALVAYLKIIAEINRSKSVLAYRRDERLKHKGHGFKVRMGFGLHAGWAIEGAVGSLQKVDATYLSPHVNMAARLETSSKQYGVPLLLSERLFELMSPAAKKKCRRLDIVTVKGSEVPIGIYTYDCLQDQVFPSRRGQQSEKPQPPRIQPKVALPPVESFDALKSTKSEISDIATIDNEQNNQLVTHIEPSKPGVAYKFCTMAYDSLEIFEMDADLLALRSHITEEFETTFQSAVDLYIAGDWSAARPLFEKANQIMLVNAPSLKGDGPSKTLLRYMENHSWSSASIGWKGFRPLTSK